MKFMKILSLDVSSVKTGWSILLAENYIECGYIHNKKLNGTYYEKIFFYFYSIKNLLDTYCPDIVLIEDTFFSKKNPKVSKVLSEYAGVTKLAVIDTLFIDPIIINNLSTKAYFKSSNKIQLFNFINDLYGLNFIYNKHNDIVDSIAQLMYYIDKYREEKDYGYRYICNNIEINYRDI